MSKVYYHHVGQEGGDLDFPKTVFKRVRLDDLVPSLDGHPEGADLLARLRAAFPDGSTNVWGIPYKATNVVRGLSPGDTVFLVGNLVLLASARVKVRAEQEHPSLSTYLWGDNRYSWVFFFDTQPILCEWQRFHDLLGYRGFRPRGNFYSVAAKSMEPHGGAAGFVGLVEGTPWTTDHPFVDHGPTRVASPTVDYESLPEELHREADRALQDMLDEPDEEQLERRLRSYQRPSRDAAFRALIRDQYNFTCTACGRRLLTPDGLGEVEAAHIQAVKGGGPDIRTNGLSLCRTHHWAFDRGLFGISDDLTIILSPALDARRVAELGLEAGRTMIMPDHQRYRPAPRFLRQHRQLHGLD